MLGSPKFPVTIARFTLRSTTNAAVAVALTLAMALPTCLAASDDADAATPATSGCTVQSKDNKVVDGSSLWNEVPGGEFGAIDCEFHQLGWNNFLYLAGDDGTGHPRLMSLTPWYDAVPASGTPTAATGYTPLQGTELRKINNEEQAGDSLLLLDVAHGVTSYDIRVNDRFVQDLQEGGWYTKAALRAATDDFNQHPATAGIWLSPAQPGDTIGALEIKTAWRDYGPSGSCPSQLMHCETDSGGNQWGLTGLLVVQKTPLHGEFIWTVIEHVANVPDCEGGFSTPIAREPTDPVTGGSLNVNSGSLAERTGWSYFDYQGFTEAGGSGTTCPYPNGAYTYDKATNTDSCGLLEGTPLCNTDPEVLGKFRQVNICRTDPLPTAATSCIGPDNVTPEQSARNVSCLNQSVLDHFPAGLDTKWKYYRMIGTQWMYDGASNDGADRTGCFNYESLNGNPVYASECPDPTEEGTTARRGNPHLASATSETWLQKGMCLPGNGLSRTVKATGLDCFSCHQPETRTYQADLSHLFGRVTQAGSTQELRLEAKTSRDAAAEPASENDEARR